jgi:hypothetical protein
MLSRFCTLEVCRSPFGRTLGCQPRIARTPSELCGPDAIRIAPLPFTVDFAQPLGVRFTITLPIDGRTRAAGRYVAIQFFVEPELIKRLLDTAPCADFHFNTCVR